MSLPELSVITVTRGRLEVLLGKLDALGRQTLDPGRFELVVCVNGDDATHAALAGVETPYALRLLRFAENRGAAVGRNACARAARAPLLYLSDDDAYPEPETLARHLQAQLEQPGLAQGEVRFEGPDGSVTARPAPSPLRYWNVHPVNTSLPRALYERVGGFDEWLVDYGHEDVLFGYKLVRAGVPLIALEDAPARHLGADPMRAGPSSRPRARSAGRNAVRVVRRHPELAYRLGAHPLLVELKRLALGPFGPLWRALDAPSYEYEHAYLQGILDERRNPS